jgi:hypothetical protein
MSTGRSSANEGDTEGSEQTICRRFSYGYRRLCGYLGLIVGVATVVYYLSLKRPYDDWQSLPWGLIFVTLLAIVSDAIYRLREPVGLTITEDTLTVRWVWKRATVSLVEVFVEGEESRLFAGERVQLIRLPDRRIVVFSELVGYSEFVDLVKHLAESKRR